MHHEPAIPPRFWIPAVLGTVVVVVLVHGGGTSPPDPAPAAARGTPPEPVAAAGEDLAVLPDATPAPESGMDSPVPGAVPVEPAAPPVEPRAVPPAPPPAEGSAAPGAGGLTLLPEDPAQQVALFSRSDFLRRCARRLGALRGAGLAGPQLSCSLETLAPFVLWSDTPQQCAALATLLEESRERLRSAFLEPAGLATGDLEPIPLALLSGLEYEETASLQGSTWVLVPEHGDVRMAAAHALHLLLWKALEARGAAALPAWLHAGAVESSLGARPPRGVPPLATLLLGEGSPEPPRLEDLLADGGSAGGQREAAGSFVDFCLRGDGGRDPSLQDALLDVLRSYAAGRIPWERESARGELARRFGVLDLADLERRWRQRVVPPEHR